MTCIYDDSDIFNGLFWVGEKAVKLGLVDGVGHIEQIIKKKFGEKTRIKIIEQKKSFLQRKVSSSMKNKLFEMSDLIDSLEEKFYWSRFGL